MNKNTNKTSYAQSERAFLKNLLVMVVVGLLVVVITNMNYKKIQEEANYRIDAAVEDAYEAGYEIGFDEGYASRNQIEIIDDWFSNIEVASVVEEDGIGTIRIVDDGDNLWVITYEATN